MRVLNSPTRMPATLLVGVLIGQFHIDISANVKSVFFLMFLFALGYGMGPQFFRGLKSDGPPQVWFSIIIRVLCLIVTWACAKIAGFDAGTAAGLLAGAQTISAVMGVAQDTINGLSLTPGSTMRRRFRRSNRLRSDAEGQARRCGTSWFAGWLDRAANVRAQLRPKRSLPFPGGMTA